MKRRDQVREARTWHRYGGGQRHGDGEIGGDDGGDDRAAAGHVAGGARSGVAGESGPRAGGGGGESGGPRRTLGGVLTSFNLAGECCCEESGRKDGIGQFRWIIRGR